MKKTSSSKLPIKILICSQRLDLASIAIYSDGNIFKFFLPITSTSIMNFNTKLLLNDSVDIVSGWLLIGLQFKSTAVKDGNIQVHAIKLDNIMKDTWNKCISSPMKRDLSLKTTNINDINHGNNGVSTAISNQNISKCDLHVALSKIEFSNHININDVHDNNLYQSSISCMILLSNDLSNSIAIVGRITNQRVVWDVNDVVLSFQQDVTLSFSIQFFLFKGNKQFNSENIIGESILLINQNQLSKGLPLNFILPFRNHDKERVALLALSIQTTSLIDNMNNNSSTISSNNNSNDNNSNSNRNNNNNSINFIENEIPLLIEFCEGNIVSNGNPNLILEPFFECTLYDEKKISNIRGNNNNNNYIANDNSVEKTRTGFLRFTETLENWNIDCMLNLPNINNTTTTTTTNNNSNNNSILTDSRVSSSAYSIGIVCRNASQQGCPQLGWTKIAIPTQLLLLNHNNKPHEQWITLSPPLTNGNNINSSIPMTYNYSNNTNNDSNEATKVCRIKIRLSIDYVNHDIANNPFGIGAVLFRMIHVNDNRLGIADAIISTTASSHAIESHDVGIQNKDKTSSITVPESSNIDDEIDDDDALFSKMDFDTVSYINEMSMFNEDNLVGALPIFGGYCDIKLKLRTLTTNISYVTSFPVMASIPKLSLSSSDSSVNTDAIISPQINSLTLSINKISNKACNNIINRSRIEPKVNIETMFVPYVKGKLVIQCTRIQFEPIINNNMSGNNREKGSNKNNGDSYSSTFALRYLLGNNSSKFMFSNSFDVMRNKNGVNSSPQMIVENVTLLDVDTFEVVSNSIRRKENSRMIPLFVSLLELQSLSSSATSREDEQQQYGKQQSCVGVGFVSTAMLYFHALRSTASCSLYTDSGSSSNNINNSSRSSSNIGSSPWMISNIDIYDPKTKLKKATITLNIKFILNSLPSHVLQMIDNSISKSISDSTALVRIELGLKQSFIMADVDKSGTVSSEELLNVIKSSSSSSSSKRENNNNNNYNNASISQKKNNETIGLDQDARILLLHLSDKSLRGNECLDDKTLHKIVKDIFEQTDIDGNGMISWWEWKTVLVASIKGKDITSKFINPLDILCVAIQAANNALLTLVPSFNENQNISTLPYLQDIQMKVPNILDSLDNISYVSGQQSQSKSVSKLHSLVKSLRLTNNILSKRLENALSTAQVLNIDIDNISAEKQQNDGNNNNNYTNNTNYNNKSYLLEINQLEKRIADTELSSSKHIISYVEAQKQTEDLNKQIIDLKNTNEFLMKRSLENKSNSSEYINKLNDQIEQHNLSLKLVKEQRSFQQKANLKIIDFLKSKGIPTFRHRKTKKQMIRLNHMIATLFYQRKYNLSRQRKQSAAISIQSVVRRRQVKKKISKQKVAVLKLQCCIRSKWARMIMFGLLKRKQDREEREAREKKEKEEREAARLLLLLKNNSSSLMSRNIRKYANKKALERKVKREREEKEAREKKEREEKEAREKKEREEKEAREKKEREEKEAREKKEREEKEAREKKEREEKEAREKKEREEKEAREKKEREEKLARRIVFILQNKSARVLLKFIRLCVEKNKLMKKIKRDREEKERKSIKSIQDAARRRYIIIIIIIIYYIETSMML